MFGRKKNQQGLEPSFVKGGGISFIGDFVPSTCRKVEAAIEGQQKEGQGSSTFYNVKVKDSGIEWTVQRRYQEFHALIEMLQRSDVSVPKPPKSKTGLNLRARFNKEFLPNREKDLNQVLQEACAADPTLEKYPHLRSFLGVEAAPTRQGSKAVIEDAQPAPPSPSSAEVPAASPSPSGRDVATGAPTSPANAPRVETTEVTVPYSVDWQDQVEKISTSFPIGVKEEDVVVSDCNGQPVLGREPSQEQFPLRVAYSRQDLSVEEVLVTTPDAIAKQLPPGPRICILGSTEFRADHTEALVVAVAEKLSASLGKEAVFLTGGMAGVQAGFARGFGDSQGLIHLLPQGQASGFDMGRDMICGATLEQRIQIFGQLGQVYLTFEGGPGVSKEASAAFERGALVLPVVSTGGASQGMFDFPAGALEKPSFVAEADWSMLAAKGPPQDAASAIARIVSSHLGIGPESAPDTLQDVAKRLPAGPRICILGGTEFRQPHTEALVAAVASTLASRLGDQVVFLTGGMGGVQSAFAKNFGESPALIHLLPEGQASGYGVGRDVPCGSTLEERIDLFGNLGHVYLSFEGGPGVAKEAAAAFKRGAMVLPAISTRGASGGDFGFPAGALLRPEAANSAQWECITDPSCAPADFATVVADIISCQLGFAQAVKRPSGITYRMTDTLDRYDEADLSSSICEQYAFDLPVIGEDPAEITDQHPEVAGDVAEMPSKVFPECTPEPSEQSKVGLAGLEGNSEQALDRLLEARRSRRRLEGRVSKMEDMLGHQSRTLGPSESRRRRPTLRCHPLESEDKFVPRTLRVVAPNTGFSGLYRAVAGEMPRGHPLYKHETDNRFIFFNSSGQWAFGGELERVERFQCSNGDAHHTVAFQFCSTPDDLPEGCWKVRSNTGKWETDASLEVTAEERADKDANVEQRLSMEMAACEALENTVRELGEQSVPRQVELIVPAEAWTAEFAGDYKVVEGLKPNGCPLYKHTKHEFHLYAGTDGTWWIGKDTAKQQQFACSIGFLQHPVQHGGLSPAFLETGKWRAHNGTEMETDAEIELKAKPSGGVCPTSAETVASQNPRPRPKSGGILSWFACCVPCR